MALIMSFFSGFEPFGEHKVNASWSAVQVRDFSKWIAKKIFHILTVGYTCQKSWHKFNKCKVIYMTFLLLLEYKCMI